MDETKIKQLIQDGIQAYMNNKQYTYSKIPAHSHTGVDSPKITVIDLPVETPIKMGVGGILTFQNPKDGAISLGMVAGQDMNGETIGTETVNSQLILQHQESGLSFFYGQRPPLYISKEGYTVSTTAGSNTLTINDYTFDTNALFGCYINITDSTGAFVETQVIISNTANTVTILNTWLASTTGTFLIEKLIYNGSADSPWKRLYVSEATDGGIRFGSGPTGGGQNGLLYMNSTGDLYWKGKNNIPTKLN